MTRDPRRPLVYMHVPKTSGTALSHGLHGALGARSPIAGFDRGMFGGFDDFASLSDERQRLVFRNPQTLPRDADLIHGHFSCSTTRAAYPEAQFLTLLREPRVRLLSLWLFWRMQTDETLAGWGSWVRTVQLARRPLGEFLADPRPACQTDNVAVRMLLWPHPLIPDDGFIDPAHDPVLGEAARLALGRFDFVDIVENPLLPDRLGGWLGRPVTYPRLNVTGPPRDGASLDLNEQLSDAAFDRLDACTRLDDRLWRTICGGTMPGHDPAHLRDRSLIRAVAGYARAGARR